MCGMIRILRCNSNHFMLHEQADVILCDLVKTLEQKLRR